jgi:LAO/AO transport system kinase
MYELAKDPRAFVRACPTSGVLGGVARYTNDVVLLCQAAAFDVVFIETVGLGQSEIMIDQTSDMLLLLVPPGGGDELQGVKKGIMEVADVVVVNKADGHLLTAAQHTAAEYKHALCFQRRKWEAWTPTVTLCSALRREKIAEVWEEVCRCSDVLDKTGFLHLKRRDQGRHWMWSSLEDLLVRKVRGSRVVEAKAGRMEEELADGTLTPRSAAEMLLAAFLEEQRTSMSGAAGGMNKKQE